MFWYITAWCCFVGWTLQCQHQQRQRQRQPPSVPLSTIAAFIQLFPEYCTLLLGIPYNTYLPTQRTRDTAGEEGGASTGAPFPQKRLGLHAQWLPVCEKSGKQAKTPWLGGVQLRKQV